MRLKAICIVQLSYDQASQRQQLLLERTYVCTLVANAPVACAIHSTLIGLFVCCAQMLLSVQGHTPALGVATRERLLPPGVLQLNAHLSFRAIVSKLCTRCGNRD